MKNLKVTALILALTLSAGMLTACSSKEENDTSVPTVETSESQVEESMEAETTESSESIEEQETLTEAVLQYITVARVEEVAEDGSLKLTMFELPETVEEGTAKESTAEESTLEEATSEESAATEESDVAEANAKIENGAVDKNANAEESVSAEESAMNEKIADTEESVSTEKETVAEDSEGEKNVETSEFDFAVLDLSIFAETEFSESYESTGNEKIRLVEDGALVEAAWSDLQEGDMLVFFLDENEVPNIIIYRGVLQKETVVK